MAPGLTLRGQMTEYGHSLFVSSTQASCFHCSATHGEARAPIAEETPSVIWRQW